MKKQILLSHGGGGEEMNSLINDTIFKAFDNEILRRANDSAILNFPLDLDKNFDIISANFGDKTDYFNEKSQNFDISNLNGQKKTDNMNFNVQNCHNKKNTQILCGNLAFTTDSFVVTPLFFNGGDIGKIAVCGTVNDLAMVGAKPLFLSCAFIIEEGLEIDTFERILNSMAKTAKEAGVKIVCGDTKVVPRGSGDQIFINTSGIGQILKAGVQMDCVKKGAKVLVSGDIGRHGAVIMAARDEISVSTDLKSDCKPLNAAVTELLKNDVKILALRDATRGGLSAALNEFAQHLNCEISIRENDIKVAPEVLGICELLGFEPYDLANEGTFVAFVEDGDETKALEILRKFNENAAIIGEVTQNEKGRVILQNAYGTERFLEFPKGELLPRIC